MRRREGATQATVADSVAAGVTIEALAEHHIPIVLAACRDWQELAQFGPPYWRPRSEAELRRKVAETAGPAMAPDYNFVLALGDGRLVGECSVHGIDWRNRVAQVGICVWRPEDRRQGYGRAALEAMVDWGFGYLGLGRLEAWIVDGNEPSLLLFRRFGFAEEGVLRGRYLASRVAHDVHVLARIASAGDAGRIRS